MPIARQARPSTIPQAILSIKVMCKELPGIRFLDSQDPAWPCREPVYLGIQRGRDVVDQVPADRQRATFIAEFKVLRKADGSPHFLGPFAHGTPADRFFYLSWGFKKNADRFEMFRRLKIRLGHLGWQEIQESMTAGHPIRVTLRLTDAKGGPLCGTPPTSHITWGVAEHS